MMQLTPLQSQLLQKANPRVGDKQPFDLTRNSFETDPTVIRFDKFLSYRVPKGHILHLQPLYFSLSLLVRYDGIATALAANTNSPSIPHGIANSKDFVTPWTVAQGVQNDIYVFDENDIERPVTRIDYVQNTFQSSAALGSGYGILYRVKDMTVTLERHQPSGSGSNVEILGEFSGRELSENYTSGKRANKFEFNGEKSLLENDRLVVGLRFPTTTGLPNPIGIVPMQPIDEKINDGLYVSDVRIPAKLQRAECDDWMAFRLLRDSGMYDLDG